MALTRKHFKQLAEIVKEMRYEYGTDALANKLAEFCRAENPRFDKQKFMKACEKGAFTK